VPYSKFGLRFWLLAVCGRGVTASQKEKDQSGAFNEATKSGEKRRRRSSIYQAESPFVWL
jgi:hypothetical protein